MTDFTDGPDLLRRLTLHRIGPTRFAGVCGHGPGRHAFGGAVAALAVLAAGRTVDAGRPLRSLHAYFLSPVSTDVPVEFDVDLVRDGRSAAIRSVTATQRGRRVFILTASFQLPGLDVRAQVPSPQGVPDPATVPVGMAVPVEVRPVTWSGPAGEPAPRQQLWCRCPVHLPDDPLVHVAAVTFASDLTLGWSPWKSLGVHRVRGEMYGASMDHAMWFHRDVQADAWLLIDQVSQAVAGGRGLAIGHIFDTEGNLVVTIAQEGLMRGIDGALDAPTDTEDDSDDFGIA